MAELKKPKSKKLIAVGTAIVFSLALAGCGSGGGVNSTPTPPPPVTPPPPPPPPPPGSSFDTAEYQRSNAAVQARAISAYNAGATGQGVIAGVIDSGIDTASAEFAGRIHPQSADLVGNRGLQDVGGHGTAVSSVLLGAKNDSGTHGVAFNSTLLVLRTDGVGSCGTDGCDHDDNDMAEAVDLARTVGARVINISLGGSPANFNLRNAIDRATAAGLVIVISAGNEFDTDPTNAVNPDLLAQIARDPIARGQVIIAGATDSNQQIAAFSNRAGNSAAYYLTALGVRVRAPDESGTAFLWSGTSFAAPVVSGAVALLAQAFPTLTGKQIVDLLLRTTTDLGATGVDTIYGNGELNIERAFQPQGQTSLAQAAVPVSLKSNGILATAMGDATRKGGPRGVVLDDFGRAYDIDFSGSLATAAIAPRLGTALQNGIDTGLAGSSGLSIALTVARRSDGVGPERLDLSPRERAQARAIAGSVITRLDRNSQVALGIGRGSDTLLDSTDFGRAISFVVADNAAQSLGFSSRPDISLAYRHGIGRVALSMSGETGDVRVWNDDLNRLQKPGYRNSKYMRSRAGADSRFGPLKLGVAGTLLEESGTILGATTNLWTGDSGAKSWFVDTMAQLALGGDWQLGGAYRRGWTRLDATGLRPERDWLQTDAWSFDATRTGILTRGDLWALRVSQPLRVRSGGINLSLPVSYDYSSLSATFGRQFVSLAPEGREQVVETSYSSPFAGGWITANAFWRQEPGHIETAPDDLGLALRFNRKF